MVADTLGAFSVRIPASGRYRLRAERIGYAAAVSAPLDLRAGDTLLVEFRLAVEAVLLAPLTVNAAPRRSLRNRRLDDFYDRKRRGWGTFFGPAEIEALQPLSIANVLQLVPGVQVRYLHGSRVRITQRGARRECVPTFYLDGQRVPAEEIASFVAGSSLRAVEVYRRGAEVPGEFASVRNWDCGAIVIWTDLTFGP